MLLFVSRRFRDSYLSYSGPPPTFWRSFCAFDGTENKRGERRNKNKKEREQCCPTCFSMQGRICWASWASGRARSRNAPKGNETADPFGPSAKAIAVTAHPRLCMPPTKAEKMERFSFTLVNSLSRRPPLMIQSLLRSPRRVSQPTNARARVPSPISFLPSFHLSCAAASTVCRIWNAAARSLTL